MKKIFEKLKFRDLLCFVIGGIVIGTIGITATSFAINSNEIQYKDNKSVQQAIEELYALANNIGKNEILPVGDVSVVSFTVTVPYTGSYDKIRCVYGTDENYGSTGTINNNICTFTGSTVNQKLYYKIVATTLTDDAEGKVYENSGSAVTSSFQPISISELELGDYIYLKPTSTSYTISSSMTGCTSTSYCNGVTNQTINPSELTVWRVIRKNSNGTVDVVSDRTSSTKVYFYGQAGYNSIVNSLTTIASQYTNSSFVQSTRYTKTTEDTDLINSSSVGLEAKNPSGIATDYWLANTKYYSFDYEDEFDNSYRGLYVNISGSISEDELRYENYPADKDYYYPSNYLRSHSIRPILTLKSSVKVIGVQDVTEDSNNIYEISL